MCGRFARTLSPSEIKEQFEIEESLDELNASYNVSPGQEISAIVFDGKKKLVKFKWGLVPPWVKDVSKGIINARSETLKEKISFRNALKKRRCLIIADGFYEWKKEGKEKTPVYIRMKNGKPFAFAGLYEFWKSSEGKIIGTCAIITTGANSVLETIHDRMPVIINHKDHKIWLDCAQDEQLVLPFLTQYPPDEMEAFEVSKAVNSPKNDFPGCIEPIKKEK